MKQVRLRLISMGTPGAGLTVNDVGQHVIQPCTSPFTDRLWQTLLWP